MGKKTIKHIFFDLDHTLWDFDKNSALTFEKIFKIHNVEVPLIDFLKHYEPINLAYWKLYRHNNVSKEALRYGRLKDSFDALGFKASKALINDLSIDYIKYLSTFNHLFEHTEVILKYLKSQYKLHIITNGFHEVQQKKMAQANIAQYFETVTDSEMVGVKKPNPLIFEYALKQAKALPEESLMIGDSLEADVYGALNSGFQAIWYNYTFQEEEDTIKQVNTLIELKSMLANNF